MGQWCAMNDFEEEFQRSGGHKNMNVRRLRDSENRESEDSESSLLWKIWCKEEQRTQAVDAEDVEVGRNGMNSSVFVSYWEHRQRRQWHPNPVPCLENPMDGGAWWAAVHGVTKART